MNARYWKFSTYTVLLFAFAQAAGAEEYGTIKGKFILKGDVPDPKVLIKKGDATVKDAAVCAAKELPSQVLLIDEKTKGIQHIFIYMRKATDVHPDLKSVATDKKVVKFDQKNCRFIPHTLFVRTDQEVNVISSDGVAHNTHTFPLRNEQQNFLLVPNDQKGRNLKHRFGEFLPMQVKCDIHPWMKAYWLVLDHPYAAITDKEGNFTIEKLPVGEHTFRIWHERAGWVIRSYKVDVKPGEQTLKTEEVALGVFMK